MFARIIASWVCVALFFVAFQSLGYSAPVLTGEVSVTDQAPGASGGIEGVVSRADNGAGVAGAVVSLPELGVRVQSGSRGEFLLPPLPKRTPERPWIVGVSKQGYLSDSIVLRGGVWERGEPLVFKLREAKRAQVIDDSLHHLGDNRYDPRSSGGDRFVLQAEGPLLTRRFSLPAGELPSDRPALEIGTLIGLDTREAQALGQSRIPYSCSPLEIRLNGREVSLVRINGNRLRVPLPPGLLRSGGSNTLEIRAGFHFNRLGQLDYDDLELMGLLLLH